MKFILRVQLVAQTNISETAFHKDIALPLSVLDELSGICGRTAGIPRYYRPGELIDAPDTWACRWQAIWDMGASRHEALQSLLTTLRPAIESQLLFCTLQWKTEPLDFLSDPS